MGMIVSPLYEANLVLLDVQVFIVRFLLASGVQSGLLHLASGAQEGFLRTVVQESFLRSKEKAQESFLRSREKAQESFLRSREKAQESFLRSREKVTDSYEFARSTKNLNIEYYFCTPWFFSWFFSTSTAGGGVRGAEIIGVEIVFFTTVREKFPFSALKDTFLSRKYKPLIRISVTNSTKLIQVGSQVKIAIPRARNPAIYKMAGPRSVMNLLTGSNTLGKYVYNGP
jgi:hypothetical protein